MCEQTELEYLPGEVVWVKLRQPSLWWPGQVQDFDLLPEEVREGLRKRPLAVVKFFQEDAYEYVNNINNIYRYICSKKHDFIKKGLELARSKRPERPAHMDLFPQDVATAETLTNGNPDIIRDDSFAPEEKTRYQGLFGSDKKKKPKNVVESILKDRPSWRVKPLIGKQSPSSPKTPPSARVTKVITHPRFINKALKGETDHKVYIREQPKVEDETASPSSEYRCHNCDFVTARLNVIVLHYRSHSKSITPTVARFKTLKPKIPRSSLAKPKSEKKSDTPVKSPSTEPAKKRNILRDATPEPAEKREKTTPKKSPKVQTPKSPAPKRKLKVDVQPEIEEKKVKKEEIQELLKDWSDEEVEEDSKIVGRDSDDDSRSDIINEKDGDEKTKEGDGDDGDTCDIGAKSPKKKVEESPKKKESASPASKSKVFDFDDSDEGLDPKLTHNASAFGRKIPRVIDNNKERRTSYSDPASPPAKSPSESRTETAKKSPKASTIVPQKETQNLSAKESPKETPKDPRGKRKLYSKPKVSVEVLEAMDVSEIAERTSRDSVDREQKEKEMADMTAEIDSLLEKTAVPDLPIVPKINAFSIDLEEDFFPDKGKENDETKDKHLLRELNSLKGSIEDVTPTPEPSKNSLPEVGSAVENTSTPPQAKAVAHTADNNARKPEKVKGAVITSVILSSPQSTSGGDHSYVSEKRLSATKMPPLVAASSLKSPPGRSPPRYIISSKSSKEVNPSILRLVTVGPTATTTTKTVAPLVKKDAKYVIVRSTKPIEQKVMPKLAPASTSPQFVTQQGKKLVLVHTKPSGDLVLASPKRATAPSAKTVPTPKTPPSVIVNASTASSIAPKSAKTSFVHTFGSPKKSMPNIIFSTAGGVFTATTSLSSKSPTSSPMSLTSSSGLHKTGVIQKTVKLVNSKDTPGKVVLQMESQKTKITMPSMTGDKPNVPLPTMQRAGSRFKLLTKDLSRPGPSLNTSGVKAVPVKSPSGSLSPSTSKKTPKQPSLFQPDPIVRTGPRSILQKNPPKKTFVVSKTPTSSPLISKPATPSQVQTKPSILQNTPRAILKRTLPRPLPTSSKTPVSVEDIKSPKSAAPVVLTASSSTAVTAPQVSAASVVATPVEGSVEGQAIMYILDNGTLISYDQVSQGNDQARTVFIDPASLTSSSGELGNLIFTFDDSGANQGTVLNIAQPTETSEFTFTSSAQRTSATQDILAEALANTQVLQAEASASELILDSSSLSSNTVTPSSALYPSNVVTLSNNVLETSLTLNQPIMTPLEVPSAVSSLQPPPAASGALDLPITIAQPDITISTSSYASLPIPSATIQGSVFSDTATATYSTIVPALSDVSGKRTYYVQASDAEGRSTVYTCEDDQVIEDTSVTLGESEDDK